jgi:hypothetical protein
MVRLLRGAKKQGIYLKAIVLGVLCELSLPVFQSWLPSDLVTYSQPDMGHIRPRDQIAPLM